MRGRPGARRDLQDQPDIAAVAALIVEPPVTFTPTASAGCADGFPRPPMTLS
jgi:hypothetical protein